MRILPRAPGAGRAGPGSLYRWDGDLPARPPQEGEPGPLRVCFLTHPPHRYSGAVFHAIWLAEKLQPMDVTVEFLAYADRLEPLPTHIASFPVHYLRPGRRIPHRYRELALWPRTLGFLIRHAFDVVHVHSCGYMEAFAGLAGRLAGSGSVANVMLEGSDLSDSGRLETPVKRWLLQRFDRIVPISSETRAEAIRFGLREEKLAKIPIGVDVDRFAPAGAEERRRLRLKHGLPPGVPMVSCIGALNDRKNVVWLLDTWMEDTTAWAGAHLLLVGDVADDAEGPRVREDVQSRLARAREQGLAIHWIPFVKEIEEIYGLSDVFVLPSLREGMPSVVLQAMASGLPVISTPVSGVRELLGEDGERGRIFDFDDRRGLTAALRVLLRDRALRESLGRTGRRHVVGAYALDRIARGYLNLYRDVSRRPGHAASGTLEPPPTAAHPSPTPE